jgi:hypothetical protein
MAKVFVVDDDDPAVRVEVFFIEDDDGEEGRCDGRCTRPGCEDFTVSATSRSTSLGDVVMDAIIHIDHHH